MPRSSAHPVVQELYLCRTMARKTIRDVAKIAGISPSTISDAENGYHMPNIKVLSMWVAALGLEIILREKDKDDIDD